MSVFACREVPDNWMACPMTPVLTIVGGETSENFDDYDDMVDGHDHSQYHNIPTSFVKETSVSNFVGLLSAYSAAIPGEVIWLENGTYTFTSAFSLNRSGNIENPIFILARNIGLAQMDVSGSSSGTDCVSVSGSYHVIGGMDWGMAYSTSGSLFYQTGSFLRITAMRAVGYTEHCVYIHGFAGGTGHEMDNCLLDQSGEGTGEQPWQYLGYSTNPALQLRHLRVHHNSFKNVVTSGGAECMMLGTAKQYIDPADDPDPELQGVKAVIENNYFFNHQADPEVITIKVPDVVVRNNRAEDCKGTLVVRSASRCLLYANWMHDMGEGSRGGMNCCTAFNYGHSVSVGRDGTVQYVGTSYDSGHADYGNWQYAPCDNGWVRNNVWAGIDRHVYVWEFTASGFFVRDPVGMVVSGNAIYSSACGQTDSAAFGGDMTYSEFIATNTYGAAGVDPQESNTYSTQNLTSVAAKTKSLFDGPGTTLDMTGAPTVFGRPTQLTAPSWWT